MEYFNLEKQISHTFFKGKQEMGNNELCNMVLKILNLLNVNILVGDSGYKLI